MNNFEPRRDLHSQEARRSWTSHIAELLKHAPLHDVDELCVRQAQDLGVDLVVVLPASGAAKH